jgi:FtsP/CotA-like multicopper oxidase with cupredoxin domain
VLVAVQSRLELMAISIPSICIAILSRSRRGDKPIAGLMKAVISVNRRTTAAVDFVADNPGLTLFHCHIQLHMDFGFMQLLLYAR